MEFKKVEDTNLAAPYTILVDCPDCYLDVLKIFLTLLEENWPHRKCRVCVSTQSKIVDGFDNIDFIKCGENRNSIQRSVFVMQTIDSEYVLTLNSDNFITKRVDNEEIQKLINFMRLNEVDYLQIWKLKNREQRKYKTAVNDIYYCNKKARYSKSLMANIWNKNAYLNLFSTVNSDGWTIEGQWLKECLDSQPGYDDNYCYCNSDPLAILHGVSKGCWIRKAYRKLRKLGFNKSDFSSRKKLSLNTTFKQNISMFVLNHFSSKMFLKFKHLGIKQNNTTNY